jgi:hypothetical protein
VIDFPEGMEHGGAPQDPGTAAHSAVCDLLVRAACSRKNAPEWLATSNSANMGAYTASLVSESPFVKGTVGDQDYYRARLLVVVDRALRVGADARHLDAADLDLVDVDLVPPSPETRNKLEEAQRAAIEIPLGTNSRQNVASEQGRDWDRIDQDNRAYQDEHGSAGAELPLPGADGTLPADPPQRQPQDGGGDGTDAHDLRGTVGGLNAISDMQARFYAGEIPRQAAVAAMRLLFGFGDQEAAALFPDVRPVDRTPPSVDAPPAGG